VRAACGFLAVAVGLGAAPAARGADHNDPNAVNSIFWDIDISSADLYDFFGFPAESPDEERVVVALTFAPVPDTGVLDPDLLYRLRFDPDRRAAPLTDESLEGMLKYAAALDELYLDLETEEVRVRVDEGGRAHLRFLGFPSGDFDAEVPTNEVATVRTPDGRVIQVFVGGRDDAFFNDLPGFFRSINYAPQFYKVPHGSPRELRETPIPKTLLELEGNDFFNFDPSRPTHGSGLKLDLPDRPFTWDGDRFLRDENGDFRFVYSGQDAQAGINVNAIVLEMPLAALTESPREERIVKAWGESWVLKAADKVETIPDDAPWHRDPRWWGAPLLAIGAVLLLARASSRSRRRTVLGVVALAGGVAVAMVAVFLAGSRANVDAELSRYKLVDTDGIPFSDAALSEREDERQLGAANVALARQFVIRLAHLGWGFSPSIRALGLKSSFDDDEIPVSVHRWPKLASTAFPRVKTALFQELNMPDDSWNPRGLDIPLRRPFEIFVPNVCAIDMDTNGSWPFGRRLEDQVATRFLSVFLDMSQTIGGQPCHVDILGNQWLWDSAPVQPKTPPNPLKNDREFLDRFPYLAEPW